MKVNGLDQPVLVFAADQYLCLLQCIRLILSWDGYYLTRNRTLGLHSVHHETFCESLFAYHIVRKEFHSLLFHSFGSYTVSKMQGYSTLLELITIHIAVRNVLTYTYGD